MIREARPADRERLRAIQTVALDEPWPDLLTAALDGAPLVVVADDGAPVVVVADDGAPVVVVADDGAPVGYALVVPGEEVAYLAELAVAPPAQGQGHGTALLEAVLDRLREAGVEELRLTARADDERVRSFYAAFGFAVAERLPDHYEDGDGVLLVRPVGETTG